MKFYRFDKEAGEKIPQLDSSIVMTKVLKATGVTHVGCIHLEENGTSGYHEAFAPQLFMVVEGNGWVCGEDKERFQVRTGEAVFWKQGEWHESGTTNSKMVAIVIESEALDPSFMPSIN